MRLKAFNGFKLLMTFIVFCCALHFYCAFTGPSENASSGGTGSEIVGTAAHDSSAVGKCLAIASSQASGFFPVKFGNIFCYQRSRVPDTNWVQSAALPRVRTDSVGGFIITDVPPGEVVVEANDGMGNSIAHSIIIDRDSAVYPIGVLTVKKTGAISIRAKTQLPGNVRFYVGVKGTRLIVRGNKTDVDVTLENIPSGIPHTISIRVYEPIYFALDISDITVLTTATRILEPFQIQ
jgi:hypothetical protein